MSGAKLPTRRFSMKINIHADDWDEARRCITEVADHIIEHGPGCSMASGGYSSGYSVQITCDPEQTGDKYRAELKDCIKANREAER